MSDDLRPLDDLVALAAAGDQAAFTALVERTLDEVRCFVALRASDADMADEAVQSTYVDAFRNITRYRPGGSVVAWLKGIARHRVQRAQRERRRWVRLEGDAWTRQVEADVPDDGGPGAVDELPALRDCLALLNPPIAALVERFYREGLPLADLALALGRSRSGLAVTLCRARAALRECLLRKGVKA